MNTKSLIKKWIFFNRLRVQVGTSPLPQPPATDTRKHWVFRNEPTWEEIHITSVIHNFPDNYTITCQGDNKIVQCSVLLYM